MHLPVLLLIFTFRALAHGTPGLFQDQYVFSAHENNPRSPLDAKFEQKVEWARKHFNIPGLAVAVSHGGIFSKGYGVSDITTSQPVTEHTLFMTGSTSKAFTAAAISLLIDDNINFPDIHWNTPVHSIIPTDFVLNDSWATSEMTIIDILSHRSGLPRHDGIWLANITLQEAVQSLRHLPLTASPRTEFQYCNLMYTVAAHIIETVTNQSFQSFLRDNIWLPQDMTETYLSLSDAKEANQDISQGYFEDLNGKVVSSEQVSVDILRGAGNILSSVSDYAKWISTLLNHGPPLSPGAYGMLFGAQFIAELYPIEPFQTPTLYGLGWMIQFYKGEAIITHGGSQVGYGADVVLLPERNFGLVILGNNMNGIGAGADILAYHLIDEELNVPLEQRYDWVTRADAAMNTTHLSKHILSELYPDLPSPPLPNPLNLSAFEGYYTHPAYPDLRISSDCISNSKAYEVLNRTTPDLCISHTRPNDYSKDMEWGLFHVSGTYWLQLVLWSGGLGASRVEFSIGSDGLVSRLGIEIEPAMAKRGEKIWWRHAQS